MLELREHQWTRDVALAPAQIDALRRIAGVEVTPSATQAGRSDLRPGSSVGVVTSGGLETWIHPKVPVRSLLHLLGYGVGRPRWSPDAVGQRDARALLEAIVPAFVAATATATRRGVLQGYAGVDDVTTTVRGRIRFDDQIRSHQGRMPPVAVRYDELTEDVLANRLLKAAILRLLYLPLRSAAHRDQLRRLALRFDRTRWVRFPRGAVPVVHFDRLNAHYRPAIALARRILADTSVDFGHGATSTSAFVVDMNQLFEDFVALALRDALGLADTEFRRGAAGRRDCLDVGGRIAIHPDLGWWRDGQCLFVGDVKYKRLDGGTGRAADLYQLLAYCTALGVRHGVLVHAGAGDRAPTHQVRGSGIELHVCSIDLGRDPAAIDAQVNAVADRVRGLAAAAGR